MNDCCSLKYVCLEEEKKLVHGFYRLEKIDGTVE